MNLLNSHFFVFINLYLDQSLLVRFFSLNKKYSNTSSAGARMQHSVEGCPNSDRANPGL